MNIFSGILVYVLVWWMAIFCVLPFGITSMPKSENGSMPGAPIHPHLKRKLLITTIIATVVWCGIYGVIKANVISFHDIAARMDM